MRNHLFGRTTVLFIVALCSGEIGEVKLFALHFEGADIFIGNLFLELAFIKSFISSNHHHIKKVRFNDLCFCFASGFPASLSPIDVIHYS